MSCNNNYNKSDPERSVLFRRDPDFHWYLVLFTKSQTTTTLILTCTTDAADSCDFKWVRDFTTLIIMAFKSLIHTLSHSLQFVSNSL